MATESDRTAYEPEDPAVDSYYRVLATMAGEGNRLATEPLMGEVVDALRQEGAKLTPAAIDEWYRRWYRDGQRERPHHQS